MPDFPRDSSQHDRGDDGADKQWTPSPSETTGRRRRSLDDGGGTRVSDLLAKHGPASKKFKPVRRAEPEPPPSTPAHGLPPASPPASPPAAPRRSPRRRAAEPAPPPVSRPAPPAAPAPIDPPSQPRVQLPPRVDDQPGKRSVERQAQRGVEQPSALGSDEPGKRSVDQPGKRSADRPGRRSAERPGKRSAEQVGKRSSEQVGKRSAEQPGRRSVEQPSARDLDPMRDVDPPSRRGVDRPSRRAAEPAQDVEQPSMRDVERPSLRNMALRRNLDQQSQPSRSPADPPSRPGMPLPLRSSGNRPSPRAKAAPPVDPPSSAGLPLGDSGPLGNNPLVNGHTPPPGNPLTNGSGRPRGPQAGPGEPVAPTRRRSPQPPSDTGEPPQAPQPPSAPRRELTGRSRPVSGGPPTDILPTGAVEALRAASGRLRRKPAAPARPPVAPQPPAAPQQAPAPLPAAAPLQAPAPPAAGIADQLNPRSPLAGRPRPSRPLPPSAHEITQEIPAIRLNGPLPPITAGPPETCDVRPRRADDEIDEAPPDERVKAIDATLARFTAVHDELAYEEAERARTSMFSWVRRIFGRDETELDESGADYDDESDGDAPAARLGKKGSKKKAKPGGLPITGKTLAVIFAVMVLIGAGYAWNSAHSSATGIRQVAALDPNSPAIQNAGKQQGDDNILIIGSDDRSDATPADNAGSAQDVPGGRSDTIMLAHLPADRSRATVISFPRDLEVQRPACEKWDPASGQYSAPQPAQDHVKINSAFAVGGPKCVTKVVQQLSGVAVNHFAGVDFQGLKSLVDSVHGVDVCAASPLKDDQLGPIVPAGHTSLTGDQALNYVRARHITGDKTADYGRIKRQQRFLSSFLRTAMAPEVMAKPAKLRAMLQTFTTSVFGDNIGLDTLLNIAQSLHGLDPAHITFLTVPTTGTANSAGNEVLKTDDAHTLFQAIINGTAVPGDPTPLPTNGDPAPQAQPTPPTAPSTVIDPHQIKVQVLNTTGRGGLAGQIGDKLTSVGYPVVLVQDSTEKVDRTVIRYSPQRTDYANTLASSVPGSELQVDPSMGGAVELFLGPGFKGGISAPSPGGSGSSDSAANSGSLPTTNGADTTCDTL